MTDWILPALIFANHSTHTLRIGPLTPGPLMLIGAFATLLAAWVGRCFDLSRPQLGSLILVSGFGSSASVGYALIGQVFSDNAESMFDAIVINTVGSTVPLFVIGVVIAHHFGQSAPDLQRGVRDSLRAFLASPVFTAPVLGLAVAFAEPPRSLLDGAVYRALHTLSGSLPVMAALTIGTRGGRTWDPTPTQ